MENRIEYGDNSLKEILEGVNLITDAVKVTYGAGGNNVIIYKPGMTPYVTKDGVTVAKEYPKEFSLRGIGINLVKQVASDTDNLASDGTTSSSVLAQAIMNKAYAKLKPSFKDRVLGRKGINLIELRRGMDIATEDVINILENKRINNISDEILKNIADVSVNGDESISGPLTEAFIKVGKSEGTITLTYGGSTNTRFEFSNGFRFESPYMFQQFINVEKEGVYKLDDLRVLVVNDDMESGEKLSNIISKYITEVEGVQTAAELTKLSFLVVARSFHDLCVKDINFIMNANPSIRIMPVRAHSIGDDRTEIIKDFAALAGARVINRNDFNNFDPEWFGNAKMAIQDANKSVVEFKDRHFKYPAVQKKISDLESLLANKELAEGDRKLLRNRLSNIRRGLATVYVGGTTLVEISEKMDRYQDALGSLMAAESQGILPGGGVSLLYVQDMLSKDDNRYYNLTYSEKIGYKIIEEALEVPFEQILINAGKNKKQIAKIRKRIEDKQYSLIFDVRADDFVQDTEYIIVDPFKVTKSAITMASSIVSTFLSNKAAILNTETFEV